MSSAEPITRTKTSGSFYYATFAFYGSSLSIISVYFPLLFTQLGLSAVAIGTAMGCQPLVMSVVPVVWGQLADRSGRPVRLFKLLLLASAVLFLGFHGAASFWSFCVFLFLSACMKSGIVALSNSIAIQHLSPRQFILSDIAPLICMTASIMLFGELFADMAPQARAAVVAAHVLLVGALLCSLRIKERPHAAAPDVRFRDMFVHFFRRRYLYFFVPRTVFWMAMGPFEILLGVHTRALGMDAAVAGRAFAVALASEFITLIVWSRYCDHLLDGRPQRWRSIERWLMAVFALTALRWWLIASTDSELVLILLQALHGMSAGVFCVLVTAQFQILVPDSMRSLGQASLVAWVYSLGSAIGYPAAGWLFDTAGGAGAFQAAAGLVCIAAVLVRWTAPQLAPPAAEAGESREVGESGAQSRSEGET